MSDRKDERKLLNEVLPDPRQAEDLRRGGPRERTAKHLKKILATAAGLAFSLPPSGARADTSPPPSPGDKNTTQANNQKNGKKPPEKTPPSPHKPPPAPPPAYFVVDPVPSPYRQPPRTPPGYLDIKCNLRAHILVDGEDTGLLTPQKKLKLDSGSHIVTLRALDGVTEDSFPVEVPVNKTLSETRVLKPNPAPAPPAPKTK